MLAPMNAEYVVAIDGGGTGCRARVYDRGGAPRGEGAAGPANLLLGDGSVAIASVRAAARAAMAAAGLRDDLRDVALSVALAGATAAGRSRFFAVDWSAGHVRLLSDTHAAVLGAHGGADGGLVVCGTGAAACILREGRLREIGGWGFAVDDFGSGADIGRRALRLALRRIDADDRPAAASSLCARILARFDTPEAAASWAAAARPADFGALALDVFETAEAGDPDAARIVDRAVAEIDRLAALTLRAGAQRVAVVGSVGRRLAPRLRGASAAALVAPQGDALFGALLAARLDRGWTG
jgi:glucosamine kinase